jgi:hypothetical protein
MNLANLLIKLTPLITDAERNWTEIVDLLDRHQDLAEYEVARHYVSEALEPLVRRGLDSLDPRQRRQGIRVVERTFSRSTAAKVLRHLVKDGNQGVRASARAAVRRLGIDDVALRDTRVQLPRNPMAIGGYNPTGWSFGILIRWGGRPPLAPEAERNALPQLPDRGALARLVGLGSADELVRFTRAGHGTGAPYIEFEVPKRSGGVRRISAPRPQLRRIQRAILDAILARLPVHPSAHGFVKGRSTVTNASPHVGAAVVLKMDLKDFFPSIHYRRLVGLFQHYGYADDVAAALASLTTHRPVLPDGTVVWPGRMPQGAPTSPALANLICRRMDTRLSGLSRKLGAVYTRYADDLTFSFAKEPTCSVGRFAWWVDQICQQEGFAENAGKRRVLRPRNQQRVTGIVINSGLHVPRSARRRFRAILHNCRTHGVDSQARGRDDFRAYLQGFAAYIKMVQPDVGAALSAEVAALLAADPGPQA